MLLCPFVRNETCHLFTYAPNNFFSINNRLCGNIHLWHCYKISNDRYTTSDWWEQFAWTKSQPSTHTHLICAAFVCVKIIYGINMRTWLEAHSIFSLRYELIKIIRFGLRLWNFITHKKYTHFFLQLINRVYVITWYKKINTERKKRTNLLNTDNI